MRVGQGVVSRISGHGTPAGPGRRLLALAASVAVIALGVSGATAARAQNAPPAPGSGWTTIFDDNFAGPAATAPNLYNWTYDTGPGSYFGDGQVETMTDSPDNVALDGHGHLVITAVHAGGVWTSGRIQTARADVGAPRGGELEVTASIEQPDPAGGAGYWPAFWLLGPGTWPKDGEIDIMESVDALSQNGSAVHCGTDPGGPCDEPAGIGSGLRPCAGGGTGFRGAECHGLGDGRGGLASLHLGRRPGLTECKVCEEQDNSRPRGQGFEGTHCVTSDKLMK